MTGETASYELRLGESPKNFFIESRPPQPDSENLTSRASGIMPLACCYLHNGATQAFRYSKEQFAGRNDDQRQKTFIGWIHYRIQELQEQDPHSQFEFVPRIESIANKTSLFEPDELH